MRALAPTIAAALGLALALGCPIREPNPGHCANGNGDAFCTTAHGSDAPFCAVGSCEPDVADGCVATRPVDAACYSPCGTGTTAADMTNCEGVAATGDLTTSITVGSTPPTSSSSTSSTGPTPDPSTTTGPECTDASECGAEAPFCDPDGACVPCSGVDNPNGGCMSLDAARPLCVDDVCVACTDENAGACTGATPVCEVLTNTCVGCRYHSECPLACDIDDGECLDDSVALYVDNDASSCGDGGENDPFCAIQDAIDAVADGNTAVLLIASNRGQYAEDLRVRDGKTIVMLPDGNAEPRITNAGGGEPTLQVSVSATSVYVEGLRFQNNFDTHAVEVSSGTLVLDRVEVVRNPAGAVLVDGSAAEVLVRNSFIGAVDANAASVLVPDGLLTSVYSTFAAEDEAAISCTSPGAVDIRNAFVFNVGSGSEFECGADEIRDSAAEDFVSASVVTVGNYAAGWFVDPSAGDFHLAGAPSEIEDVARWEIGDPATDIDGDPRPQAVDAPDVAGADGTP